MIFGIFAILLIVLLLYKSTLIMHRTIWLFLDDASSYMHERNTERWQRSVRLTELMRVFRIGSGHF